MIQCLQLPLLQPLLLFPFFPFSSCFAKSPTLEPCLTEKPQAYQAAVDKNGSDSYWDVIVPRIPSRRNGKVERFSTKPTASEVNEMDAGGSSYGTYADHIRRPAARRFLPCCSEKPRHPRAAYVLLPCPAPVRGRRFYGKCRSDIKHDWRSGP